MVVLLISLLLFLTSCSFTEIEGHTGERYGLPQVAVEMPENEFHNLDKESFVNEWTGITFGIEDQVVDAAIRRHGSTSRKLYKNSYCIRTADRDRIYSSQSTDMSYLRYMLAAFVYNKAGLYTGEVTPVWLNINGTDQGLYLYREPVDIQFYSRQGIEPRTIYSMTGASLFTLKDERNSFHSFKKEYPKKSISQMDLVQFLGTVDIVSETRNWKLLESVADVYSVLDYYAVSRLISSWDGNNKNLHLWSDSKSGKFSITPWDLNFTFMGEVDGELPHYYNGLFELLLENDEYREYVTMREMQLFDYDELVTELSTLRDQIKEAYSHDPYLKQQGWNQETAYQEIIRYLQSVDRVLQNRNG